MQSQIKISIIIPSYNQGKFIEETLLSIINQSYKNFEIIVIDGGSSDNTIEILKQYNDKITFWVSEPDKGTYDANNKGLQKMSGDYWMVVNSDDTLLPNALEQIVHSINENPDQKWFAGGVKYLDENGNITGEFSPQKPQVNNVNSFLLGCWLSHPAVCLSSKLIKEIGTFDKYHLMDLNYWLRLEHAGYTPLIMSSYLAGLRIHNDCKSSDKIKLIEENLRVVKDFTTNINLNNTYVNNILTYLKADINKLKINAALIQNKKRRTTLLVFKQFGLQPNVVFKRWFWGSIKRLFWGLKKNDQILKGNSQLNNKANWNKL